MADREALLLDELRQIKAALLRLVELTEMDMDLEPSEPGCPKCGSHDSQDASTMGNPRRVCVGCGTVVTNG